MTICSDQYERVVAVYLTADDIRRIIDDVPFHRSSPGYNDGSARLGLKLMAALMSIETAPVVERAIVLTTVERGSSS